MLSRTSFTASLTVLSREACAPYSSFEERLSRLCGSFGGGVVLRRPCSRSLSSPVWRSLSSPVLFRSSYCRLLASFPSLVSPASFFRVLPSLALRVFPYLPFLTLVFFVSCGLCLVLFCGCVCSHCVHCLCVIGHSRALPCCFVLRGSGPGCRFLRFWSFFYFCLRSSALR